MDRDMDRTDTVWVRQAAGVEFFFADVDLAGGGSTTVNIFDYYYVVLTVASKSTKAEIGIRINDAKNGLVIPRNGWYRILYTVQVLANYKKVHGDPSFGGVMGVILRKNGNEMSHAGDSLKLDVISGGLSQTMLDADNHSIYGSGIMHLNLHGSAIVSLKKDDVIRVACESTYCTFTTGTGSLIIEKIK